MADRRTVSYYAMYVIGEVESNWNWTSINYNDPITIGMMQWYGTRAAALLIRMKNELPSIYEQVVASLRSDLEANAPSSSYWTSRYLTAAEGASIARIFTNSEPRIIQENQAIADFDGYITTLTGWGMSLDNPRALVFAMSMYHQSPKRAGEVVRAVGGSASLEQLYAACMNNSVLSKYRTRYTKNRNRLSEWDGESYPPDFGQVGEEPETYGDADIGADGASRTPAAITHVVSNGSQLIIYGEDYPNGLICYKTGRASWYPQRNTRGATVPTTPTDPPQEPEPGTTVQKNIVDLFMSWEDMFKYSQAPGRENPVKSGYGDCSSTIQYAYKTVAGVDPGGWTGAMLGKGRLIQSGGASTAVNVSQLQLADLVLVKHRNSGGRKVDHVEMYVGNGELWGHGGPDTGPDSSGQIVPYLGRKYYWEIRRYL